MCSCTGAYSCSVILLTVLLLFTRLTRLQEKISPVKYAPAASTLRFPIHAPHFLRGRGNKTGKKRRESCSLSLDVGPGSVEAS